MELIKIEKYLDTPTTSCDTTSSVNDCYFLVPEKMRHYFNGVEVGLFDIQTKKKYEFPVVDGREFRLTQFNSYINDKKITMGDQIIIYVLRNNDDGLSFYIDTQYKDFLLQVNESDNLYKLYVSEEFQNLFLETNKIELPLDNDDKIIIEKIGDEYSIDGVDKKRFILEKDNDIYKIINLERAKATKIDADLIEDVVQNPEYVQKDIMKSLPKNSYISFLNIFENTLGKIELKNITLNIQFNIGQPNTGKSYKFEESRIFEGVDSKHYQYLKIPVSGGIGNEYKGLQNTDLAITYDPIKEELRFGEFLQMLMSAIVNPKVPHVVFLDDFHNQDISSLLSEYTPLFKGQQKRDIEDIATNHTIYNPTFNDVAEFIKQWNEFIESHCNDIPIVPLTNRISGASLKLVYPSNFYLLGAANFNENSLNIFADWEDRADINYIDPIKSFTKEDETNDFLQCCRKLNQELKELLESKNIFDYEKYCFGMWKIVDAEGAIESNPNEQKKLITFFFSMIKNSLKHNNKNSEINSIGWELLVKMQEDTWFKKNIEELDNTTDIDYKILHKHNIYEDEI